MRTLAPFLHEVWYDDYVFDENGETLSKEEQPECSSVRNGNFIGRNLDFYLNDTPEFIVHVAADSSKGRLASVGVAMHSGLREDGVTNGQYSTSYELVPNRTLDGINEKGVAINQNVVAYDREVAAGPGQEFNGTNPTGEVLNISFVPRFVLDHATNAAHGVELIKSRNLVGISVSGDLLHYMVSDSNETYVVEIITNTVVARHMKVMTNFCLNWDNGNACAVTDDDDGWDMEDYPDPNDLASGKGSMRAITNAIAQVYAKHAEGVERFIRLRDNYDEGATFDGMAALLHRVRYSQAATLETQPYWYSDRTSVALDELLANAGYPDMANIRMLYALKYLGNINLDKLLEDYLMADERTCLADKDRYRKADTGVWLTVHNTTYDIARRMFRITVQEEYDKTFNVLLEPDYLSFTARGGEVKISMKAWISEYGYKISDPLILETATDKNGPWTQFTALADSVTVPEDSTMYFRRKGEATALTLSPTNAYYYSFHFDGEGVVEAGGNVMALLDRSCEQAEVGECAFRGLFNDYVCRDKLTSAPALPAMKLAAQCYAEMFANCSALTNAPALPATDLAERCYAQMFSWCSSLGVASELSATNLAERCYVGMFSQCVSLTNVQATLPAMELTEGCYGNMFDGCSALVNVPTLPATNLVTDCYARMFCACALVEAPKLPAMEMAVGCYNGMFSRCEALTKAPDLPSVNLAERCYASMFSGCKSLTDAPRLTAMELANSCYASMFNGCNSLTNAPALPATNLVSQCYRDMFGGCWSLTKAPELPAMHLANECYGVMFQQCYALTNAPALPATDLAERCYFGMFMNCTNLEVVTVAFTEWDEWDESQSATCWWFDGVTGTGTFVCPYELDVSVATVPRNENHIPEGWAVVGGHVEISVPAALPGCAYAVSNLTDEAELSVAGDEPGGAAYWLPNGKTVGIYVSAPAKKGYVIEGDNPYLIDSVTPTTTVNPDDLPKVRAILADWIMIPTESYFGEYSMVEGFVMSVTNPPNIEFDLPTVEWKLGFIVKWPSGVDNRTPPEEAKIRLSTPFGELELTGADILAGNTDGESLSLATNSFGYVSNVTWEVYMTPEEVYFMHDSGMIDLEYVMTAGAEASDLRPGGIVDTDFSLVIPLGNLELRDINEYRVYPVHLHTWTFTPMLGYILEAKCTSDPEYELECATPECVALSLGLLPGSRYRYTGRPIAFELHNVEAFRYQTGALVGEVVYRDGEGNLLESAPIRAGSYVAEVTVTPMGADRVTLSRSFSIYGGPTLTERVEAVLGVAADRAAALRIANLEFRDAMRFRLVVDDARANGDVVVSGEQIAPFIWVASDLSGEFAETVDPSRIVIDPNTRKITIVPRSDAKQEFFRFDIPIKP